MPASFSTLTFQLSQLTDMIDHGSIGLPEIQRPFVWKRAKVRDLFDSMYRGFPVGYFLFWRNASPGAKTIGTGPHQAVPDRMIVDGQQRLTSLYSVVRRVPVVDEDYKEARIEIAFNPLEETFAVSSPAYRRNKQWIADIAQLWQPETRLYRFVGDYLEALRGDMVVDDEVERRVNDAIDRLVNLRSYNFTAIELSAETDAEAVADIFVRINSAGVELNQADFILTLMSVYWDEGRKQLEKFCRAAKQPALGKASPFNYFIDPSPDQLLRVAIGYGFRRGRLKAVYNLLRGKDVDESGRSGGERNFAILAGAQVQVLALSNWHEFLQCVMLAGFRSGRLITATNTLLYGYVLFLLGKIDYAVPRDRLRQLIARWIFMSAVTSRYSGSYESTIEADLNRINIAAGAEEFITTLDRIMADTLTDDYWQINLPRELETTAARSPALYAYYAALNLLDARVLFSPMAVRELLDPAIRGDRLAIERHHLFPTAHLRKIGFETARDYDQIANFALLEWPTNARISDTAPADYSPPLFAQHAPAEAARMRRWHALPDGWESMAYPAFLATRRKLLAGVVRDGFDAIGRAPSEEPVITSSTTNAVPAIADLITQGESGMVEFKSTGRWSVRDGRIHDGVELGIVKTIAGFLNTAGGTLVIGVDDAGIPIGLELDYATLRKQDRDGFELWLSDLVQTTMGKNALSSITMDFARLDDRDIARVSIRRAPRLVFVNPSKGPSVDDVYVRFGNSTRKLTPAELLQYHSDWSGAEQSPLSTGEAMMPEGL